MPNVNEFYNDFLTAVGDTTGAKNVNEFRTKVIVAATDNIVKGTTIIALGGTITGATGNDTMTAIADITTAAAISTSDTYTDLAVNNGIDAAVDTAVNAAIAEIEDNFKDLQDKVNELVTAIA